MRRNFSDAPVDTDLLDGLLDLARRAPSAGHTQATELVVLDGPAATGRYWEVTLPPGDRRNQFKWPGLLVAPVIVLVCTRPDAYLARYGESDKSGTGRSAGYDRWPVPYWWFDAGAVAQNLLLLAADAGLGACLFGPFDYEDELRETFGLSPDTRIAAAVAVGHPLPDTPGRSTARGWKPMTEVVRRITG